MAGRFQFGLGAMFAVIAAVAVVVAVAISFGEGALALLMLLASIYLVAGGVVKHQLPYVYAGCGLFALLAALSPFLLTEARWIGSATVSLRFVVLDSATRQPIDGALVEICTGESPNQVLAGSRSVAQGRSAADGTVTIRHTFTTTGRSGWWNHSGHVYSMERWIKISATGYQTSVLFLDDLIGRSRDLDAPPPPVIEVLLDETEAVENEQPQTVTGSMPRSD